MTRFIPLPRELFDRSLSDADLQDRWVEGATKQLRKLYADRKEWVRVRDAIHPDEFDDGLQGLDKAIAKAEAFLQDAKRAQAEHHRRERKDGPQQLPDPPPQVQALLSRRSPAEVQALLEGRASQGQELAGAPSRLPLPKPPKSRRQVLRDYDKQQTQDVLEVEWRPLLPPPTK